MRDMQCESADIPAVPELLSSIARSIVAKASPITGEQVRFLRKRLGLNAKVFANLVGMKPETLSKIENDRAPAQLGLDKLVRFLYTGLAREHQVDLKKIALWTAELSKISGCERIFAIRDANEQWIIEAA